MAQKKSKRKKCIYKQKKYWYHVSTTLKKKKVRLIPWDESKGYNRAGHEPSGTRICVAPSIEQCITAIPYILSANLSIYRTEKKMLAVKARQIFDAVLTHEGWLHDPTTFIRIGKLNFLHIEKRLKIENVMPESASKGNPSYSGKVLKWWKKVKIKRFIK